MQLLKIEKMDQPISGYDYNIKFLSGENMENLHYCGNGKFIETKKEVMNILKSQIAYRTAEIKAAMEDYNQRKTEPQDAVFMEIMEILFGSIENYNKRMMEIMRKDHQEALKNYMVIKAYQNNYLQLA